MVLGVSSRDDCDGGGGVGGSGDCGVLKCFT